MTEHEHNFQRTHLDTHIKGRVWRSFRCECGESYSSEMFGDGEPVDRRDRDDLADRDDLMMLAADAYVKALVTAEVPHVWRYVADAILAAGWVHWPHDCDTEAELIAQWAHTSFETMQELHRLRAENASLRRRLVEAGALDPSESVGE